MLRLVLGNPVLQDGVLLCHVANAICPASLQIKITTDMKKADSNDYFNNKLKAKYRENIGNFLQACGEVLQMPTQDLFHPEDLADGRGTKQVLNCLSSLGRHCYYSRSMGYAGPYLEKPHALSRDEAGMLHAVKSGDGLWGKAAGDHFSGGINVSRQSRSPSVAGSDARPRNGSEYTRVSRGASLLNQTRS
ncbi:hypothetical protein CYMTET_25336 [Cymbomonas tetramitiformis]|uniref:Calponin-homology (CH) domain-containing protein n=1 Tax=Cymbomonas tetramitiformis TaxID=36881 RepID=A0AAE0FTX7_9CHLO|nr:hypothetical protein CYMTET_25336 [Cymbomonas tetramitiformis]